jgi:hypothetical protein
MKKYISFFIIFIILVSVFVAYYSAVPESAYGYCYKADLKLPPSFRCVYTIKDAIRGHLIQNALKNNPLKKTIKVWDDDELITIIRTGKNSYTVTDKLGSYSTEEID